MTPRDGGPVAAEGRAAPPSRVVATAGHVDHGKSTLVEWLTGTNPDRLEEERRRGLTIDLGFASRVLDCGVEIGVVDVPGHVRFLRNMVSGVGAIDACMFVVAANEGWKPQSEDHLRILDALGTPRGLVALTHAAVTEPDAMASSRREVCERVAGTFLEGAPVVAVDVPGGVGLEELRSAIEAMVAELPPAEDRGRARVWIDRSFAMRGAGAVVTGTLWGGQMKVGELFEVVAPGRAVGRAVRVRGIETYGRSVAVADPGRRVALNLAGIDHHTISRGDALVHADLWHRSQMVDASLSVVPTLGRPVTQRGAYLAHLGTSDQAVRLRVLGGAAEIAPGAKGAVRLRLSAALPVAPGDRYVLREAGRREVVGGGMLLDVDPVLPAAVAAPCISTERVVAERGWVDAERLSRITGERVEPSLGHWVVDPGRLARDRAALEARVRAAGPSGLDLSSMGEHDRAVVGTLEGVRISHGVVQVAADQDELETHPYLAALRAGGFDPPTPEGVDRNDLRRLVRSGLVVETGGLWFASSRVEEAVARISSLLEEHPAGVRVAEVRDALGASRRTVLPLLTHLDAVGVTRRNGDLRTAGPALVRAERASS